MPPGTVSSENRDEKSEFDALCSACLEAVAGGDEAALTTLYEATLTRVYSVAFRVINDATLAEDIVTDVYYEVWQKAGQYNAGRGRPITWLLTICRNRALDEYRRRSSHQKKIQAAALDVPTHAEGPDTLLEATETGHVLHRLIAEMPLEQRQLVALAFFKGFSHQQIADFTSMPLGSVKSAIRRALKTLGAALPSEVSASG